MNWLLALVACTGDPPVEPGPTGVDTDTPTDPGAPTVLCDDVQDAFAACQGCHGATPVYGPSFVDPASAVGADSLQSSLPLVAPYDPQGSYLLHKVRGTHLDVEGSGSVMPPPPFPPLGDGPSSTIEAWIQDGGRCAEAPPPEADTDTDADADTDADSDTDTDADTDPVGPFPDCDDVQPVLDAACLSCHDAQNLGGLDLRDVGALVGDGAIGASMPYIAPGSRSGSYLWLKVTDQHLAAGGAGTAMPPPPLPALSPSDLAVLGGWIDGGASCGPVDTDTDTEDTDIPALPVEVGASPRFARLTHLQWEHTVRDLLGLGPTGQSETFLGDVLSPGGFDNDGRVLQVTPVLWLDHQRGAESVGKAVIFDRARYMAVVPEDPAADAVIAPRQVLQAEADMTPTTGGASGNAWMVWANGSVYADVELPPGDWRFTARVWGNQAGPDLARASLRVDGVDLLTTDVAGTSNDTAEEHTVSFTATGGVQRVSVHFLNDYNGADGDRNLLVDHVALEPDADPTYDEVTDRPLAEQWVRRFGARAHRRPLTDPQVDAYLALFDVGTELEYTGFPFRDGVYTVLLAMLQSPHFVYRMELEDTPDATGFIPLDGYTVASKLSYGLWNTMPDQALFDAAEDGTLLDPAGLRAEAERLLDAPRATPAVDHFHRQLLNLDSYANIYKDPVAFPQWDPSLNDAMVEEALHYARDAVLVSDASIYGFYTAPHTFVTDELAPLYGLSVGSSTPVRVDLDPAQRAGLLTQIGFLAANAHAVEIDSIHRGVFVNLRVLCSDLPPPPNVVPPLPPPQPGLQNRQRVEQHTGVGTCGQGCHSTMINPVGFAFENFDALGRWQTMDAGAPIQAHGTFEFHSGPESWNDVVGFASVLGDSVDAHRCLVGNWLRYTHGRDLTPEDRNLVNRLADESLATDRPIRETLLELVTSDAFRSRAPEVTP